MRRRHTLFCLLFVPMAQEWAQRVEEPQARIDGGFQSVLEPSRGWEAIGQGFQLTADSAVDNAGNVYFTDARRNRIWKIDSDGKLTIWKENSGGTHGVAMGPDGRLYAGQHDRKRIVAYSTDGQETILAEGVQTHHLTITKRNGVYFADAPNHKVWLLDSAGKKRVATNEVDWPHGLRVSADQSKLIVTDLHNGNVWLFGIQADGSLINGKPFCRLTIPRKRSEIEPGGVTSDTEGYAYVATRIGVQVCDPGGNVAEIIRPPGNEGLSDVFFAGPNLQWLYATDGDRIFRRYVKRRGATAGR